MDHRKRGPHANGHVPLLLQPQHGCSKVTAGHKIICGEVGKMVATGKDVLDKALLVLKCTIL